MEYENQRTYLKRFRTHKNIEFTIAIEPRKQKRND